MLRIFIAIFMVLHGVVHFLYAGQSFRWFELEPGLVWPDGSWALSRVLANNGVRMAGGALMLIGGLGFLLAGASNLISGQWSPFFVIGAASLSTASYILLWNGTTNGLPSQGAIGILLNIAVVLLLYVLSIPGLEP